MGASVVSTKYNIKTKFEDIKKKILKNNSNVYFSCTSFWFFLSLFFNQSSELILSAYEEQKSSSLRTFVHSLTQMANDQKSH